ncbi:primosomal protein DnaI [Paenibacillus sp. N1-5-1-14]|uniref:primosomal protein DnaI n=1 Tax=Paenibacillus radicibacter TaxID=2972488 RepID=UPI0021591A8C|nr:primosomal protein DnaI [Paenibacillus radicibacter]MCR8645254.1 primosomal protein DnaI [Paenibacillus radicibacter]
MESLSQILKQFAEGPFMKSGEERAQQILQDPLILKFRQKHPELDEHTLRVNMNRLYQCVKEYKNCANCPGLERCPNDLQGHYAVLTVEQQGTYSYIHETKAACKKQLAYAAEQTLRSRIRTYHVDDKAILENHSFEQIIGKDLERAKAVDQIQDYIIKTMEEGLQKKGLYLYGSFGTGKTFLMCYMLHKLAKEGHTGAIVYMPDFAEDLKGMFGDAGALRETIEALKDTDVLIFDDIGAENLNPWLRDHVLGAILNYRMNRKPTFFTSNYDLDSLEKHLSFTNKDGDEEHKGQRIMDRIRPFVDKVEVLGENKRGQS